MSNILLKDKIILIDNFLSESECCKYINEIYERKTVRNFTSVGKFKNEKYIDEILSIFFFDKLKNFIQNKSLIIKPNNIIMTGKYSPNEHFGMHLDTGLYYDKIKKEKSKFTLLVYLNDNFDGGETCFYDNNLNFILSVKPKKSMALLFDIDLWHKGNEVINGEKYWIGCEIIGKF